jgi:hypothetical protein
VNHEGLAEGDHTLLRPGDRALKEKEVVFDDAVMREATQRCDGFLRDVVLGRGIALIFTTANTVNLFVDLRSVVVTICRVKVL